MPTLSSPEDVLQCHKVLMLMRLSLALFLWKLDGI